MSKLHALYVCLRNQVYLFACLLREKYLLFPLLAAMAVIITMFLYEAEPFNISIWHDRFKLLKLSGYGFIYAGMLGLTILGVKRKYIYPETLNWTSLLNLLFILSLLVFIIGILNWIYTLTVYRHYQANWVSFFLSIRHTVTFSLFPFFFYMIHLGYKLNLIPGFVRNAINET
jgi:hypothetical protein